MIQPQKSHPVVFGPHCPLLDDTTQDVCFVHLNIWQRYLQRIHAERIINFGTSGWFMQTVQKQKLDRAATTKMGSTQYGF